MRRVWRVVAWLVFCGLVCGGLALSPAAAQAIPGIDSCTFLPETTGNQANVDPGPGLVAASMVRPDNVSDASRLTVYETLQGQGQTWTTHGRTVKDKAGCNVMDQAQTSLANMVLEVNDALAETTVLVYATATNTHGLVSELLSRSESSAKNLESDFFRPLAWFMFFSVGCWIIWVAVTTGGRAHIREMLSKIGVASGVVIVVATLIAGGWYIKIVKGLDDMTAQVQSSVTSTMLSGGNEGGPCNVPDGDPDEGRREMACQMWYSMAFLPWSIGQYGVTGTEKVPYAGTDYTGGKMPDDFRFQQLWTQTYSVTEYDDISGASTQGTLADPDMIKRKGENWDSLADRARESANGKHTDAEQTAWNIAYGAWRGEGSGSRFTTAFNALGGSVITSIAVVWLSVINLVYQVLPVLAFLSLAVIGLLAMFPKLNWLMKEWFQMIAKTYLMRLVTGVALGLLLLLMKSILEMNMAPPVTGIYQLVIAIGLIMLFRMVKNRAIPATQTEQDAGRTASTATSTTRSVVSTAGRVLDRSGGGRGAGWLYAAGAVLAGRRRGGSADAEATGREARERRERERDAYADVGADERPTPRRRPGAPGATRRTEKALDRASDALTETASILGDSATRAADAAEAAESARTAARASGGDAQAQDPIVVRPSVITRHGAEPTTQVIDVDVEVR